MVITAILIHRKRTLRINRSAKLAAPDDNRVFKQPTLFQILHQCPRSLIRVPHLALNRTGQAAVVVPAHVETLHHSGTALAQTTRQQTVLRKASWPMHIRAVALKRLRRLTAEVGQLWNGCLHPESHFVLCDARIDFWVADNRTALEVDF